MSWVSVCGSVPNGSPASLRVSNAEVWHCAVTCCNNGHVTRYHGHTPIHDVDLCLVDNLLDRCGNDCSSTHIYLCHCGAAVGVGARYESPTRIQLRQSCDTELSALLEAERIQCVGCSSWRIVGLEPGSSADLVHWHGLRWSRRSMFLRRHTAHMA
jgi:hypothetical protein